MSLWGKRMRETIVIYSRAIREQCIDKQNNLNRAIGELSFLIDDVVLSYNPLKWQPKRNFAEQ